MRRFAVILLVLSVFISCKSTVSKVIFQSEMGEMTFVISDRLSGEAVSKLEELLSAKADTLAVARVLHDGFIQLNFQMPDTKFAAGKTDMPLSGTFVVSNGRFYIVQGRKHTDASLDKWEKQTGQKITPAFRAFYKNPGGALQLEGKCLVLGTLVSGKETLDRIAALPNDANGRPLRAVPVHLNGFR